MALPENISKLLPLAVTWMEEQVAYIQKHGTALTEDQEIDAFLAGVSDPQKIRLLKVDSVPFPDAPLLKKALNEIGLLTGASIGLSLGHGIFIQKNHWDNRRVVVHELAHTMQYERMGGTEFFLRQYVEECIDQGYHFAPLEIEAREIEKKICG